MRFDGCGYETQLDLAEVRCSEGFLSEARENPRLEIVKEPEDVCFDKNGDLVDF